MTYTIYVQIDHYLSILSVRCINGMTRGSAGQTSKKEKASVFFSFGVYNLSPQNLLCCPQAKDKAPCSHAQLTALLKTEKNVYIHCHALFSSTVAHYYARLSTIPSLRVRANPMVKRQALYIPSHEVRGTSAATGHPAKEKQAPRPRQLRLLFSCFPSEHTGVEAPGCYVNFRLEEDTCLPASSR